MGRAPTRTIPAMRVVFSPTAGWPWLGVFALAIMPPVLMAYSRSPSPTVLNQLLSLGGWAVVVTAIGMRGPTEARGAWRSPLICALALLGAAVLWSMVRGLPDSIAYSALAVLTAAALIVRLGQEPGVAVGGRAFYWALLAAGVASAAIALVQVFAPQWTDAVWLARSSQPGRAVGNVRQPNHLSSVLVWALVAAVPLAEPLLQGGRRWLRQAACLAVMGLLVWAVVLSGSRTGGLSMLVLALWGLVDRRLGGFLRLALLAMPVLYGLAWWGMDAWAAAGHTLSSTEHLRAGFEGGDISSSRFRIWSDTLALIAQQPWLGVGFGEFNFAWSLTALPNRPVAFFDHTHNLPLQLLVELGVPLGTLVLVLLLTALGQAAWRAWRDTNPVTATGARAAVMVVLMIGLHSLLEYPLWFAYFLLPTAWAWGLALRQPNLARRPWVRSPAQWPTLAGGVMLALVLFATYEYLRVAAIYSTRAGGGPLTQRIADGQATVFYGAQADYAAATSLLEPAAFGRATHLLLDTRLMVAWARMLAATNHEDPARHIAQRLREFRNPASNDFFTPCGGPPTGDFQCQTPNVQLNWRDFQELQR